MSGVDFFPAEARDCLRELDGLLDSEAPPADLRPAARRLRGSAQMASREQSLRVASALESAVRAAERGDLAWGAGTRTTLAAAVSELARIVESDSAAGAEQALTRLRALGDVVERSGAPDATPRANEIDFQAFARAELTRIAAALETAASAARAGRPERAPLHALLDAQAALAGSARLAELPLVARALEIADQLARALLAGAPGGDAWTQALREVAAVLGAGARGPDVATGEQLARLERARSVAGPSGADPEVPVEVANFFRSEARAELARAEQLALDAAERRIATAEDRLRGVLASLATTAITFGFADIAATLEGGVEVVDATPASELPAAVANLSAAVLGALGPSPAAARERSRGGASAPAPIVTAAADEEAGEDGAGARASAPETRADGAAALDCDPDGAVPIASLCYSGESALRRAAALRERWRSAGHDAAREIVEEVFDLIELARA